MADLAGDPALARALLARCAGFALELARRASAEMPLDWLWCGDDVAGQRSMVMSPESWRDLVKPLLADLFAVGQRHGLWVAHHCCGALRPIVPDLVEIGLDVLNPVQADARAWTPGAEAGVRRPARFHGRRRHAAPAAVLPGRRGAEQR